MPRAPRIEYPGAIYHVMNRGDHLEPIYRDDQDRDIFLKTLGQTCQSTGWLIHSFVLMKNHYHLLLETPRSNLVRGMQRLNSTYTQRYNSRHKTRGHLFQGRYKALLIDGESENYFLTVSDYIHMNPVRIGKAKTLPQILNDPWSSAGPLESDSAERFPWLSWQRLYGELGHRHRNLQARRDFRKHLQEQLQNVADTQGWDKIRRGWCLGSEGFVEQMKEKLGNLLGRKPENENWRGEQVQEAEEQKAARLLVLGLRRWKMSRPAQVQGQDRYLLAMWLRDHTAVRNQWLRETFGLRTTGGMRNGITLMRRQMMENKRLRERWRQLQKCL